MDVKLRLLEETGPNRPVNVMMEESMTMNHSYYPSNTSDGSTYDVFYDYYNVGDRAERILVKPDKIIALILGTIALGANMLSLVVVCRLMLKVRGQASHFAFIISLGASDMLCSVSVMLHIINRVFNPIHYPGHGSANLRLQSRCTYSLIKALNTTALNVTLLNLMGMAIDHYIAILKPLHYTRILNKKCYIIMIVIFWIIALLCGFSDFFSVFYEWREWQTYQDKFNLCEFVFLTPYQEEYTVFAIAFLCLITMHYTYLKIYCEVKKHQQRGPAIYAFQRSKKALATTLLILGTFMLCWLPMCIFQIALIIQVHVDPDQVERLVHILVNADQHLYNLLLLNAICDPIIYAVRIKELRHDYLSILSRICICYYVDFKAFPKLRWKNHSSAFISYIAVDNGRRHRIYRSQPSCSSITEIERSMSRSSTKSHGGLMKSNSLTKEEDYKNETNI